MSAITVYVTNGFQEYADIIITEGTGKDISGDVFQVALSASSVTPPPAGSTAWVTPSVSTAGAGNFQRVLKLMITTPTAPGVWWLWAKIADNPELVPECRPSPITVV